MTSLKTTFATQLVFFQLFAFDLPGALNLLISTEIVCPIILRSIAFLQKLQNEIKKLLF